MEFSSVTFVVQFDCLDDDIDNLNWLESDLIAREILESTPIGDRIRPSDDEAVSWIQGDVSLHEYQDFAAALKRNTVRYQVLNIGFEGHLDEKQMVSWHELRQALLGLRVQRFEDTEQWGGFTAAPVSISLGELTPSNSEKAVLLDIGQGITFLDKLDEAASSREDIASFLKYFESDIASYRQGKASRFLQTWFSTELLLTQATFDFEEGEFTHSYLKPVLSVDQFEWRSGSVPVGVLLAGDRQFRSDNTFWVSPLPKNTFSDHADWYHIYQDAIDESIRKGATGTKFNQTSFIMTMWHLNLFLEEHDAGDTEYKIEEFMARHRTALEVMFGLIQESQFDFESFLDIPSEPHSFLQRLAIPETAEEIWNDYLSVIGMQSS